MKILANDGISTEGIQLLENNGFEVNTTKVAQEQVANYINKHNISILLVRNATKVRKEIIDDCPTLKIIGKGGTDMDNIDVKYAQSKGIHVINTPKSSAEAVAELVFAHLFSGVRFLTESNRSMPLEGDSYFNRLKSEYEQGKELRGKTLGLIGFGLIGQAVAKIAVGLGMNVIAADKAVKNAVITLDFFNGQKIDFTIETTSFDQVLTQSDFISIHTPHQNDYLIGADEFEKMKDGVGIINTSAGGIVDEVALVTNIDSGKVAFAGLDVFENEPHPAIQILMHPKISLTPHIGASTIEVQNRMSKELAEQIISILK